MNQLQTLPTYLTTLSTAFALTTLTMMGCTNKAGIDSASTQDASSSSSSSSSGSSNQSTAASYTVTIPIAVSFPLSVGSSSNGNLLSLQAPLVSVLGSSASSLLADIIANPSGANASKIVQIISSSSGLVGYTTLGSCVTSSGQWADTAVLIPGSSLAVIAKERLNLSGAQVIVHPQGLYVIVGGVDLVSMSPNVNAKILSASGIVSTVANVVPGATAMYPLKLAIADATLETLLLSHASYYTPVLTTADIKSGINASVVIGRSISATTFDNVTLLTLPNHVRVLGTGYTTCSNFFICLGDALTIKQLFDTGSSLAPTPTPTPTPVATTGGDLQLNAPTVGFTVPQMVGSAGVSKTFTVKNIGTTNATITAMSMSNTADFSFVTPASCGIGVVVYPGNTCAINVKFKPTARGTRSNTLSVSYSGGPSATMTKTITMQGQGIIPGKMVPTTSTEYDFGTHSLGVSVTANIWFKNDGDTDVRVNTSNEEDHTSPFSFNSMSGARLSEPDHNYFWISDSSNCAGKLIAPGATCAVRVTYKVKVGFPSGLCRHAYLAVGYYVIQTATYSASDNSSMRGCRN